MKTKGIHHISSMVGDAQKDVDFYASVLAYRMVKKTLNYDDKTMYHLYYGNHDASSGLVTTFPMNFTHQGIVGSGQLGIAGFGLRPENFDFWKERLEDFGIETEEHTRFNRRRLAFDDPDGLELEFIETDKGPENEWAFNGVASEQAIIGIESSLLYSKKPAETLHLLTEIMGYEIIDENPDYYLLKIHDELGGILELAKRAPRRGIPGVGTVHHIAFAVENDEIEAWHKKLKEAGYRPTEVKNRNYFQSLYFRESGGILFEFATEGPGMLIDEDLENLGEKLITPPHFREEERALLPEIEVRTIDEL